ITGQPKSGYTPAVGDLVIRDTTVAYGFDLTATDENPGGEVIAVGPGGAHMTVELYTPGTIAVLKYSAAPSLGNKIEVGGTSNQVRADNSNGTGSVIAVDRVAGYCDVLF